MKNLLFKKLFFILTVLIVSTFAGCDNNEDVLPTVNDIEVINNGTMLKFKDQATLIETLESLMKEPNKTDFGINSLYLIYNEAMEEADEAYSSIENYTSYKEKYQNSLLFPEYEDDYSAYLPVSSKILAKVLNSEGKVMVGDEVVDYRDMHTYQDLQDAGIAWIESPQLRSNSYESAYEYSSDGKYKIRIKINNTPQRNPLQTLFGIFPGNTTGILHFEVTYRFKGAFGIWYNHRAHLDFEFGLHIKRYDAQYTHVVGLTYLQIPSQHTYETSSVDHWYRDYPLEYYGYVRVQYHGIDKTWIVSRNLTLDDVNRFLNNR